MLRGCVLALFGWQVVHSGSSIAMTKDRYVVSSQSHYIEVANSKQSQLMYYWKWSQLWKNWGLQPCVLKLDGL